MFWFCLWWVVLSNSEGLTMEKDPLLELVQNTPTNEIHHLIEWLFEDDEEQDNVIHKE
jgi:hypothetical protein